MLDNYLDSDTREGDFARAVKDDPDFPVNGECAGVYLHLTEHRRRYRQAAIDAFYICWDKYKYTYRTQFRS